MFNNVFAAVKKLSKNNLANPNQNACNLVRQARMNFDTATCVDNLEHCRKLHEKWFSLFLACQKIQEDTKIKKESLMNGKFLLINVLSKESFEDCRIPGSVNVPLSNLKNYVANLDRSTEILVYCASYQCEASRQAWQILDELGFTNVKAYEGGIREWYQNGLPVEGVCKAAFLNEINLRAENEDEFVQTISLKELQSKLQNAPQISKDENITPKKEQSKPRERTKPQTQAKPKEYEQQTLSQALEKKPAQTPIKIDEKVDEQTGHEEAHELTLKKYFPFIVALLVVIGLSLIRQFMYGYNPILWTNDFMGSFFAVFGILKIVNLKKFVILFSEYDLVAKQTIWYAYLYPFIELALAVAFFTQISPLTVNIITFIIMNISLLGVLSAFNKKQRLTCACMGGWFDVPLSYITIFENVLMGAMSLVMILFILINK